MLGGILDEEELKYLTGKYYIDGHIFTPLKTSDGIWILPLYQIYYWWVKYLPIIEIKTNK
jgi:hypothetical protein